MNALNERRVWLLALVTSLAFHGLAAVLIPSAEHEKKPEPIMTVRLTMTPAQQKTSAAQPPAEPSPVQKPVPKPKTTAKPVKKTVEKPVKPMQAEIAETPADTGAAVEETTGGAVTETPDGNASGSGNSAGGSGAGESLVDVGALQITKKVIPDYPAFSRKRKEEGTVKIIVTIDGGRVTKAEIESSSGYERLDASALRAVRQWRFNHSGTIRARVPITFKLD